MKHLGDITKISGYDIAPVDVCSFGAPCQDLSVAGLRRGMQHEENGDEETTRSGLFYEAIRIIKEMRDKYRSARGSDDILCGRYAIYENVPGAFSSNSGRDWQAVVTSLVRIAEPNAPDVPMPEEGKWPYAGLIYDELGKWSVAWRTVDAQYFGTPQRRKRVCCLADLDGLTAGEILFDIKLERTTEDGEPVTLNRHTGCESEREVSSECESMPGDTQSSGTEGESATAGTEGRFGVSVDGRSEPVYGGADGAVRGETSGRSGPVGQATGRDGLGRNGADTRSYTLKVRGGREIDSSGKRAGKGALIQTELSGTIGVSQDQTLIQCESCGETFPSEDEINGLAPAECPRCGEERRLQAVKTEAVSVDVYNQTVDGDITATVTANTGISNHSGPKLLQKVAIPLEGNGQRESHYGNGYGDENDPSFTLNAVEHHAVCFGMSPMESNAMKSSNPNSGIYEAETSKTLDIKGANPSCNQGGIMVVSSTPEMASAGFSFGQSAKARSLGYEKEKSPTLKGGEGGNQKPCALVYDPRENGNSPTTTEDHKKSTAYALDQQGGKGGANFAEEVCPPILSDSHGTPHAVCYDSRGNGNGETSPTITGDHQNRVTDYTAIVVEDEHSSDAGVGL